ncbi:zinc-dependent alcohol dehydrogenase family protein [Luminiphilus sp.]|nr:zinc-dependent alcohol dehydrogenase family protein [Luminiphilus sp.]
MKTFSLIMTAAMFLGLAALSQADGHSEHHDAALTMRQYAEFNEIGNPADVLTVKAAAPQALESGEVRVRVLAAPINPSDLLQIAGQYGVAAVLPAKAGSEGVGRVVEVTPEASTLKEGQLVLILGGGTWSDEVVAPEAGFLPLPDMGPLAPEVIEQLGMSVVNPVTALLMLNDFVELSDGQWIVQSAANSAVGGYVIQLAKQRGIKTVNVVRREGLAEQLYAKGADVVLIDGPDLAEQIAEATGGEPVALALDPVGGETYTRLTTSLAYGGTIVAYGMLSGQAATLNTGMAIFKDIRNRSFWLAKWYESATLAEKQATFGKIIPLIASGVLTADVDSRFAVSDITAAVTRAAQDGRNGKVLVVPAPE